MTTPQEISISLVELAWNVKLPSRSAVARAAKE
jgi:hypothetical protein